MLEFKELSKKYTSNGPLAVDSLNLTIEEGEIVGFLGHNGAGKTTTIKMLTGLLYPTKGKSLINGLNIVDNPIEYKMSFGFVPDEPNLIPRMTVFAYLKFLKNVYSIDDRTFNSHIEYFHQEFGIKDFLEKVIEDCSHGMKQKVAITGALLHNPYLFILDEPLVGLDPKSAYNFKNILTARAKEKKIVFFSSHSVDLVEKICTKIAIFKKGYLLFYGTINELHNQYGNGKKTFEEIVLELM